MELERDFDLKTSNSFFICQVDRDQLKTIALHTAGAREIWIDQSRFNRREKNQCPDVDVS